MYWLPAPFSCPVLFRRPGLCQARCSVYLTDRTAWIRNLFDAAVQQYASYQPVRAPVKKLEREVQNAEALSTSELHRIVRELSTQMQTLLDKHELNGPLHEDLMRLKMLRARCQKVINRR